MKMLTLPYLKNKWQGCDCIVCGLGTSLNQLEHPERYLTIGVNDIGASFTPSVIVCIDPLTRFKVGNRKNDILKTNPRYFVSQLDPKAYPGLVAENYVKFRLGKRTGVGFNYGNNDRLDYHNTSTYVALNLAAYMGVKNIFLIGFDLSNNHFNRKSGVHALSKRVAEIDKQLAKFNQECKRNGVRLINLSKTSRLTSLVKGDIKDVQQSDTCVEKHIVPPKQLPPPEKQTVKRGGDRRSRQPGKAAQPNSKRPNKRNVRNRKGK